MPRKVLVIADTHIPDRADDVPSAALELIGSLDFDVVVHAGDLCGPEVLEWLKKLGAKEVYVVMGNMDYLELPDRVLFEAEGVRIGVVHGHQVYPRGDVEKLTRIARRMGADVLISGHTHYPFVREYGGVLHVNPGSLTGVWGGGGGSMKPSLAYMTVESGSVTVEVYEESGGKMKLVKRVEWRKGR